MAGEVIIRKQKVRLRTTDEQLALRMRQLINDELQSELERVFERVFEQNIPDELYINIDKLSIDMGVMFESDFKKSFIQILEPKLANELQKQLSEYMKPDTLGDTPGAAGPDDPGTLELNSFAEQEFKALMRFLETGIFPWWYPQKDQKTPADILNAFGDDGSEKLLLNLIRLRRSHTAAAFDAIAERLFLHLDPSRYELMVGSLLNLLNNSRVKVNSEAVLSNRAAISSIFALSEKKFYRHLFAFLLQDDVAATDSFMVNYFQRIISLEKINTESLRENIFNVQRGGFDELVANILDTEGARDNESVDTKEHVIFSEPEEAIYIGNAGLLLLHPFLQPLFSDSGLLEPDFKSFVSEQSRHKAAVLLYYLQSGRADYKEWEMPLNKILCGLTYQEVIPDDILLSDMDKQNCSELLTAVVSHWSALKGAGIEALRNTFLLRAAKMTFKEDRWIIQVERTGTDILLDRLPWGYSTIKLPWLRELILTQW